jgi:hypothetical protein
MELQPVTAFIYFILKGLEVKNLIQKGLEPNSVAKWSETAKLGARRTQRFVKQRPMCTSLWLDPLITCVLTL